MKGDTNGTLNAHRTSSTGMTRKEKLIRGKQRQEGEEEEQQQQAQNENE